MPVFLILAVLALGYYIFKLYYPFRRLWHYGNKLPGVKPYPLIGNANVFFGSDKTKLQIINELCTEYGPVTRIWLGPQLFAILSDPSDLEVFLTSTVHLNKSDSYRLMDRWIGTKGLLTSDAEVWRSHRKLLTPCFHFKLLEDMVGVIKKNAKILSQQLRSRVDGPEFDVYDYIEKLSLDVICETAMGICLESQTSSNTEYLDNVKKIEVSTMTRVFSPWMHPEFFFKLTKAGQVFFNSLKLVKTAGWKVIMERKQFLENSEFQDIKGRKQQKQFLDFLLTADSFTDEEIENEVQTFMFAGHDTTTSGISFLLYVLATHQDVQEKLVNEIRNTLSKIPEPTMQDYVSMKYLDCVVKESLRLYTVVPIISRKVEEDVTLPSGYTLPAGSLANMNVFHMHRNEKYFQNAQQFTPERFMDKENMDPFSFIPFSAGPRNCIGQKLALLEIKIATSTILREYTLLPPTKIKSLILENELVLRSLNKIPIRIMKREHSF